MGGAVLVAGAVATSLAVDPIVGLAGGPVLVVAQRSVGPDERRGLDEAADGVSVRLAVSAGEVSALDDAVELGLGLAERARNVDVASRVPRVTRAHGADVRAG